MFALGHLVFELVKISILGFTYGTIIFFILRITGIFKSNFWSYNVASKELVFWILSGVLISILLFVFMFSYWGDHGLGDNARIPIGNGKEVSQIDGSTSWIQNCSNNQVSITNFIYDNNNLYAEIDKRWAENDSNYVIWNLKTDKWKLYKTKDDYLKVAKANNYPLPETFSNFDSYYSKYWNRWRFWLLP